MSLIVLSTLLAAAFGKQLNDFPIIGVFAQPSTNSNPACGGSCEYIAASYVKYLESAGARVVPVSYYSTTEELDLLLKGLNGFFLPGGGASYPQSVQYMFDNVKAANDAGNYTPLWGTCMGFQWLIISASRNANILDPKNGQMDSYNYSIPLDFTEEAAGSRLFANAGDDLMNILGTEEVTMNNHHYGIWTDHFKSVESLSGFYNMLSTNKDRNGDEFVSTIEAFDYPIYGTQWHPEKNNFEYSEDKNGVPAEAINHSFHAIQVAQYTANFFVNEARKNFNVMNEADENERLIYNYQTVRTDNGGSFVETYFFHDFPSVRK